MKPTPIVATILLVVGMMSSSCKKDCYDQNLFDQYSTIDCTADCPGVTGCDGNAYCNECLANQNGIAVE